MWFAQLDFGLGPSPVSLYKTHTIRREISHYPGTAAKKRKSISAQKAKWIEWVTDWLTEWLTDTTVGLWILWPAWRGVAFSFCRFYALLVNINSDSPIYIFNTWLPRLTPNKSCPEDRSAPPAGAIVSRYWQAINTNRSNQQAGRQQQQQQQAAVFCGWSQFRKRVQDPRRRYLSDKQTEGQTARPAVEAEDQESRGHGLSLADQINQRKLHVKLMQKRRSPRWLAFPAPRPIKCI